MLGKLKICSLSPASSIVKWEQIQSRFGRFLSNLSMPIEVKIFFMAKSIAPFE